MEGEHGEKTGWDWYFYEHYLLLNIDFEIVKYLKNKKIKWN